MKLIINGREMEMEEGMTIADILQRLGIEEKVMAVAINTQIVKKEEWDRYRPKDGDRLEFLTFVGGG